MRTVTTAAELRAVLDAERSAGRTVGFVPTMGYLHDGHASLIRAAAAADDVVVTSIFVNPLQFAPSEDLAAYPRDLDGDRRVAEAAGGALVFAPTEDEMYPGGRGAVLTTVAVPALAGVMEGESRPTHFAGVCTVVAKLFHLVGPCRAWFGEKDYQQLAILRRMAIDLSFPVDVVGAPTVREPDGLALSSRNVYLTAEEREVAPVLQRALQAGAAAIAGGETDADVVRRTMAAVVDAAPLGALDYVEVADADTLEPLEVARPDARLFGAVRFGRARLIDNIAASGTGAGAAGPSSTGSDGGSAT
ncbi:pantoate--beta-alanine ligase [Dermatobacter hominis]|uniref:pantoate--beta-alanine ligase n=1 Tax=Dermatobacter hominis TaxID=2884263 RepID=UPI0035ABBB6E